MKSVNSLLQPPKGRFLHRSRVGALTVFVLITLSMLATSSAQGAWPAKAPAEPAAPPPGWTLDYVDALPNFANMTNRSMAFRGGQPCIAYGGDRLYFSCYNSASNSWGTATIVDDGLRVGEYTSLDFNSYGQAYISYYDVAQARLKLAYQIGGVWQLPIVVESKPVPCPADLAPEESKDRSAEEELRDRLKPWMAQLEKSPLEGLPALLPSDPNGVGKHSSIYIDYLNRIHISYYDECNGALRYAFWDTGIFWKYVTVDSYPTGGDVGLWTSIAVDSKERVHISYMSDKYDQLKYARGRFPYGQFDWDIVELEDRNSGTGAYTAIDLIPGLVNGQLVDIPHIIYFDFAHDNLRHAWITKYGVWNKENVDTEGSVGWFAGMRILGDKMYVTYYDATKDVLRFAVLGNNWSFTNISVGILDYFTSVGLNGAGNPGIAYFDAGRGYLRYIYWNGRIWVATPIVNYTGNVGISSSLVLNSTGVPFISYYDIALGHLKYARAYGSSWDPTTVVANPHSGAFSGIDLLTETRPRIAFYDSDNTALWDTNQDINYHWWFDIVDSTYEVGEFLSMELDSSNNPHISYYDATHRDLRYATWNVGPSTWYTETLDQYGEDIGLYTSLTLDAGNKSHISYYDDTNGALKYMYQTPAGGWSVPMTVDNSSLKVGLYTSVALDSSGNPHISYYDAENMVLKYAYWNGGGWTVDTLDSAAPTGMYTSLAIDKTDDSRHLCYYDAANGNLMYAEWTGAWNFYVMDDVGDVGVTCSIALAPGDKVGISYYDYARGDLKFAHNYALPPVMFYIPIVFNP